MFVIEIEMTDFDYTQDLDSVLERFPNSQLERAVAQKSWLDGAQCVGDADRPESHFGRTLY